jgi:hypothetical protein
MDANSILVLVLVPVPVPIACACKALEDEMPGKCQSSCVGIIYSVLR